MKKIGLIAKPIAGMGIGRVVGSLLDTEDIRNAKGHVNKYIKKKITSDNSVSVRRSYEF